MKQETKICQNCKKEFIIELEDFDFYAKIKVPPPTFCPECRLIRRMIFRNERNLYKRKCDLCKKNIVAMFSIDTLLKVFCHDCWFSDLWEALNYGKEYDWGQPFFNQWKNLLLRTPLFGLHMLRVNIDSEFINYAFDNKNCYLAYSVIECENVMYSDYIDKSKDCIDSTYLRNSELCYENIDSDNNFQSIFLIQSRNCINSAFLFDCVNCQNCFLSLNLRNKNYFIQNVQYSKDGYFKNLAKFNLGSYSNLALLREEFKRLILDKSLHKYANIIKSVNAIGDNITNSKNVKEIFGGYDLENVRYVVRGVRAKDVYDGYGVSGELVYEGLASGLNVYRQYFYFLNDNNRETFYSCLCYNCSDCFGCIGLRHKQYCILNKQYTKEEYERLVPKIIEHMNKMPYVDKKGRVYRYGEFFPSELSPFCYNETIAQEYFPLTKEQAIEQGYSWKEPEDRDIKIDIKAEDLPDHIKDVKDDILGKVIECAHQGKCNEQCTTAFKIIEPELQFYRRMNLPLPRLCPNCRHYQRLKQRNPLKLWHRKCQCTGSQSENGVYKNTIEHFHTKEPCPNEFETTYAPERKEIVYCEKCYLAEVV